MSEEELHGFVDGVLDRGRSKAVVGLSGRLSGGCGARPVLAAAKRNDSRGLRGAGNGAAALAFAQNLARPRERGGRSRRAFPLVARALVPAADWACLCERRAADGGRGLFCRPPGRARQHAAPCLERPGGATADAAFAARAMAALKGFEPPAGGAAGLAAEEGGGEQDEAAPVLPNLPAEGLKLTAVRVVPGERGKMLCMFYTKQDAGDLALCAEKTPGPSETLARFSGTFPMHMISWRQKGANYALAGEIPELELRALADFVHAEVEAFDGK